MPAAILVLALCAGTLQVLTQKVLLTDAAAQTARALARGDAAPQRPPGAVLEDERDGDLLCVLLRRPATGPLGSLGVDVSARGCALAGGR